MIPFPCPVELYAQMTEAEEFDAATRQNLKVLGYGE